MSNDITEKIMEEYGRRVDVYKRFTIKTEELIKDILKNDDAVSSITSRVKDKSSLEEKLKKPDKPYSNLNEVTDIAGVRIVTYYYDGVDKVKKMICDEFKIDRKNSVDKRLLMDPDRFGYLSLHCIANLSQDRLKLREYKEFSDYKVEIQIRSILQHAWAENEHDTGYKSKESIPKELRRSFSRLAGLLEIADSEFLRIRSSLQDYEKNVTPQISENPEGVPINKVTLNGFIKTNDLVAELDKKIRIATKLESKEEETDPNSFIDNLIDKLKYVGLKNMDDIISSLHEFGDVIVNITCMAAETGDGGHDKLLHKGICLFNLVEVKVASNGSEEYVEYLEKFGIGSEEGWKQEADYRVSNYKQARANLKFNKTLQWDL